MSEMKQMKFRIANPEQFDDLIDVLLSLGWGFRNNEQHPGYWKATRRNTAGYVYTCVLSNSTRYVLDYGISESYFTENSDDYQEMDTPSFIRSTIQDLIGQAINEVGSGHDTDLFTALADQARQMIAVERFRHPHHDIMIALANDSRTIVEVLRRDGKWAVTDNPVFNPSQQFRIGKSKLEKLIDELVVEIGDDPDKLSQAKKALSKI